MMKKKLKSIIASLLVMGGVIGSTSVDSYAATKTVKASGAVPALYFMGGKPQAYLYTYNSSGKFVAKYKLSLSIKPNLMTGGDYKLSLGRTKLDDKKVSKVCLQLRSDMGTKYSSRVNLKSGTYSITMNKYGVPTIK